MDVSRAISVEDLRTMAPARLPRAVFDFIDGAAADERTLRANTADFESVRLVPRGPLAFGSSDWIAPLRTSSTVRCPRCAAQPENAVPS